MIIRIKVLSIFQSKLNVESALLYFNKLLIMIVISFFVRLHSDLLPKFIPQNLVFYNLFLYLEPSKQLQTMKNT